MRVKHERLDGPAGLVGKETPEREAGGGGAGRGVGGRGGAGVEAGNRGGEGKKKRRLKLNPGRLPVAPALYRWGFWANFPNLGLRYVVLAASGRKG